jgi:hypothetical protein
MDINKAVENKGDADYEPDITEYDLKAVMINTEEGVTTKERQLLLPGVAS